VTNIVSHLFHLVSLSSATPEKLTDELISEMDENEDGVITEEELIAAFLRQVRLTADS
jgi:Ca2+-binding EF-hand superfamily protein